MGEGAMKQMKKLAIVTGCTGNLGPVWMETLLEMDFDVYGCDVQDYDISNQTQIQRYATYLIAHLGVPAVIVNNAGIDNPPSGNASTFFGNLERILQVNLMGACYMAEAFIPAMIENGGGMIVNIGSIQGFVGADWRNYPQGFEKPVAYNLSKAALCQLSRSIRVQYGRHNVRSVTLAFGPVEMGKYTEDFKGKFLNNVPMGRFINRDSLKAAMRFAIDCPDVAGQTILVDGGYTIL